MDNTGSAKRAIHRFSAVIFAAEPRLKLRALFALLLLSFLWVGLSSLTRANDFVCPSGNPAMADIGDGVIMKTCMLQQSSGAVIRVGPLELVKNGITILKTQTDADGKLHGHFATWDDAGKIMESGHYHRGHKVGEWSVIDDRGQVSILQYREGVLIEP